MTLVLARRLLRGRVVPPGIVESSLAEACRDGGVCFARALLQAEGGFYAAQIESHLEQTEAPLIATVRVVPELFALLPSGMAERLLAVPVRHDIRLGTIDVAAVDPFDAHIPSEFAYHLRSSIRVLRAPYTAISTALAALSSGASSAKSPAAEVLGSWSAPRSHVPSHIGSDPPITFRGIPPAPNAGVGAQSAPPLRVPFTPRHDSEPAIPLVRRSLPPASALAARGRAIQIEPLEAIRKASTPAELVQALCQAGSVLGAEVVVFALKTRAYVAQGTSAANVDLKLLQISAQESSVLSAASERGFYFGSVPDTPTHAALAVALPRCMQSEVYALPIKVGQRSVLVLFLACFEHAYALTRRADALAQAASQVLTEIVRSGRT